MKILVVDDEKDLLEMLELFLEGRGDTTFVAENGASALVLYEEEAQSIDVALIDHKMPIMNGIELIGHIRKLNPALPIILMSGDLEVTQEEVKHLSLFEVISKPAKLSTMEATFCKVESTLSHREDGDQHT